MFKPKKKINENAIKKDFFNIEKKEDGINKLIQTEFDKTEFKIVSKIIGLKLPESGTILNVVTTLNNSSIDLILGKNISELIVICSRINIKSIEKINHIENKYLLVSNVVQERSNEIFEFALRSFKHINTLKNHAKMLLFISDGKYFVCETSANPSINARNEFYNIYQSEYSYNKIMKCLKIKE